MESTAFSFAFTKAYFLIVIIEINKINFANFNEIICFN